jgi:hypothetical protein
VVIFIMRCSDYLEVALLIRKCEAQLVRIAATFSFERFHRPSW